LLILQLVVKLSNVNKHHLEYLTIFCSLVMCSFKRESYDNPSFITVSQDAALHSAHKLYTKIQR